MPLPYVGAVVHFVNYGAPANDPAECKAALVTALPEGQKDDGEGVVSFNVNYPDGNILTIRRAAQNEQSHEGGTWHWPELPDATV